MALKNDILKYIESFPGTTDTELEKVLRKNHQYVNQTCRSLQTEGFLVRQKNPEKDYHIGNYPTGKVPVITITAEPKKEKSTHIQTITDAGIEELHQMVANSTNYGKEALIIRDVLNTFPRNDDINTIAMKISVIDVTNSTNLSRYKSKISLYDLAKVILEIPNFDERLAAGDPELVNIIARNTGAINLFSFASKYCTYHNVEIYEQDDYSIFDGIVKETLPRYKKGLTKSKLEAWRTSFDYVSFNNCIGEVLDANNIHLPFRRRKFDHFLWYANR